MSHFFDNAIQWMELAKVQYDQLGDVVVDVCKALGNIEIRDIDVALFQVARRQEVVERDTWISQLTREKEELQARLLKTEWSLKLEESKTQGAHRLIGLLEEHVRNLGDLVTKAQIFRRGRGKDRECHRPQVNSHLCGLFLQDGDYLGGNESSMRYLTISGLFVEL